MSYKIAGLRANIDINILNAYVSRYPDGEL
jgi:hypothetical protein